MILYYAGIAFTIATAVTCVRRGQTNPWIWIILFFPPVGGAVYVFTEVLGSHSFRGFAGSRTASKRELKVAEAEVRRLDNSEAWTSFAQALRSRKQFDQARQAASSAVERDPTSWRALNELGLAQMGLGDYDQAATHLAKVVELEPAHAAGEAAFALAVSLEKAGAKTKPDRCSISSPGHRRFPRFSSASPHSKPKPGKRAMHGSPSSASSPKPSTSRRTTAVKYDPGCDAPKKPSLPLPA